MVRALPDGEARILIRGLCIQGVSWRVRASFPSACTVSCLASAGYLSPVPQGPEGPHLHTIIWRLQVFQGKLFFFSIHWTLTEDLPCVLPMLVLWLQRWKALTSAFKESTVSKRRQAHKSDAIVPVRSLVIKPCARPQLSGRRHGWQLRCGLDEPHWTVWI